MEDKIYIFSKDRPNNQKSQDFYYKYIKKNYKNIENKFLQNDSILTNFLDQNLDKKLKIVFFYMRSTNNLKYIKLIYKKYSKSKNTFYFFSWDWWNIPSKSFLNFKSKNIKFISVWPKNRNLINNLIYPLYKNSTNHNDLDTRCLYFRLHSVYDKSIVKINNNPINKIGLAGALSDSRKLFLDSYKYRWFIKDNKYVEILKRDNGMKVNNNNFNKRLNNYLCNFTSSIHFLNVLTNKFQCINIALLKIYEILGSGSLLLFPLQEEDVTKDLGLINKKHYYLIDMEADLDSQFSYLLDPKNRNEVDEIRKNGQKFGIENLSSKQLIEEFIKLIKNN